MEQTQEIRYGDENLGYKVLSRDLSPEQAKDILVENMNDGVYERMPDERRIALHKKMKEGDLELNLN